MMIHEMPRGGGQKTPFDPNIPQWEFFKQQGGLSSATLDECIETLFSLLPPHELPDFSAIHAKCIEIGYMSWNGWTICFVTNEGESTL